MGNCGSDASADLDEALVRPGGLRWAHAVNDREYLQRAIADDSYSMFETDLCWNVTHNVPVMGHRATSEGPLESEFTFEEWLDPVLKHNADHPDNVKGFKLDFKNLECIKPCVAILKTRVEQGSRLPQVWLNGDIIFGPRPPAGGEHTRLDPVRFIQDCLGDPPTVIPGVTLSLGFTTGWTIWARFGYKYEEEHINDMIKTIDERIPPDQPISFAIRASLARRSWPQLRRLVDRSWRTARPSLTLWTTDEGVPEDDLIWIRGVSKTEGFECHEDCAKGPRAGWWNPFVLRA